MLRIGKQSKETKKKEELDEKVINSEGVGKSEEQGDGKSIWDRLRSLWGRTITGRSNSEEGTDKFKDKINDLKKGISDLEEKTSNWNERDKVDNLIDEIGNLVEKINDLGEDEDKIDNLLKEEIGGLRERISNLARWSDNVNKMNNLKKRVNNLIEWTDDLNIDNLIREINLDKIDDLERKISKLEKQEIGRLGKEIKGTWEEEISNFKKRINYLKQRTYCFYEIDSLKKGISDLEERISELEEETDSLDKIEMNYLRKRVDRLEKQEIIRLTWDSVGLEQSIDGLEEETDSSDEIDNSKERRSNLDEIDDLRRKVDRRALWVISKSNNIKKKKNLREE